MFGGMMETLGFGRDSKSFHPTYKPKPSEEKVLSLVRERWEGDMDASRQQFERIWFNAAQIYQGDFSGYWNAALRRVEKTPVPSWRKRYIANKILPTVKRAISMTVGTGARPMVVPGGSEKLFRDRAKLAEKIWESFATRRKFVTRQQYGALVACCSGSVLFKPYWDPDLGRVLGNKGGRLVTEGDVGWDVISPLNFYPEPNAKSMEESQYCFHVRMMPIDAMRRRWKQAKYVAPDSGDTGTRGWIERRLRAISSSGSIITEPSSRRGRQYATVVEMWVRPNAELPRGMMAVVSNNVVLESGPNPNVGLDADRILELPFIKYDWFEGYERFWGVGLVELLDRIIREENSTKTRLIEAAILMAHPMIRAPKQSGLGDVVGFPGQILKYNPAFPPPEFMPPPDIPAYATGLIEVFGRDFQDVSSQHDVTQGQTSNVRTGAAIQLLQQPDELVHSTGRMRFWEASSDLARSLLILMKDNYEEQRIAEVAGPNNQWQVIPFRGADLGNATNLRFVMDTSLGLTRAARLGVLTDIINLQGINMADPFERRHALRLMQSADLEGLFASLDIAEREADEEIAIMTDTSTGLPPRVPVFPWQDHAVHVRVKNHFRWTSEYKMLPMVVRQLYDANVMEHEQILLQQQMLEQQQQMATRGMPGETGTPSPPRPQSSPPQGGPEGRQMSDVA